MIDNHIVHVIHRSSTCQIHPPIILQYTVSNPNLFCGLLYVVVIRAILVFFSEKEGKICSLFCSTAF